MYTRIDLQNGICTPDQYYEQFITHRIKNFVVGMIGQEWIIACKSLDEIPVQRWNAVAQNLGKMISRVLLSDCDDYCSLYFGTMVAKKSAQQAKDEFSSNFTMRVM